MFSAPALHAAAFHHLQDMPLYHQYAPEYHAHIPYDDFHLRMDDIDLQQLDKANDIEKDPYFTVSEELYKNQKARINEEAKLRSDWIKSYSEEKALDN